MWLIRLLADLPLDMDPEVRADLIQRTRDLLSEWPGDVWRVPGGLTWVALIEAPDPHTLVAALPLHPWLQVSVEPLVGE
ncbi:MAG: muconolactone Delta-isomerase family protein [Corynebacterium sp.]|uniref:muconolactone Delta-isomerase family protein n=1 Tax=Corynebacterium sp. TaxID=1720 RepID=UPI0026E10841|nr:muconolactone Delta-isomerase family protein [Corynebacterium sp.]MDO5669979.1 muconolactone Delta-isomerase family protein [Corynebacterium sp.]